VRLQVLEQVRGVGIPTENPGTTWANPAAGTLSDTASTEPWTAVCTEASATEGAHDIAGSSHRIDRRRVVVDIGSPNRGAKHQRQDDRHGGNPGRTAPQDRQASG